MYEQSWESTHACVVKYILALPLSKARRARLASQTRTCMGSLRETVRSLSQQIWDLTSTAWKICRDVPSLIPY
jgi:hypothetical protein